MQREALGAEAGQGRLGRASVLFSKPQGVVEDLGGEVETVAKGMVWRPCAHRGVFLKVSGKGVQFGALLSCCLARQQGLNC